jgi:hypothetical protein
MKSSAIFVDMVEGLVDHKEMASRVTSSKLFGFGFEAQPGTFGDYDGNVWAAPAYGWVTDDSMYGTVEKWVENMIQVTKNQFPNQVN